MGILQRFKDIMASNINALLDKAEDPEKMIDQTLRNLTKDLAEVKKETAAVMADEQRCKRELDEVNSEITKMQAYAEKALLAGNEADAMKFLEQKNQLTAKQASLQQTYDVAAANAMKMRQMHDKLVTDINQLDSRRDAIKAKMKVAKTQDRLNKMTNNLSDSASSMAAFDRMEAKANAMLDQANAMTELNQTTQESGIDSLAAKYDAAPNAAVQDELAAMKAKLGLQKKPVVKKDDGKNTNTVQKISLKAGKKVVKSGKTITLKPGKTLQLKLTVNGIKAKNVKYTTSNKKIVKVSKKGKIKALKKSKKAVKVTISFGNSKILLKIKTK